MSGGVRYKCCYKRILLFLLTAFLFNNLKAQQYNLHLTYKDSGKRDFLNKKNTFSYSDSLSIIYGLDSVITSLQFRGYLLAEITKIDWSKNTAHAEINMNQRFLLVHLQNGNVNPKYLSKTAYQERLFNNIPFNEKQLSALLKELLSVYENNGYPFASASMDSIRIVDSLISAKLYVYPNHLITMDSVVVVGSAKLSKTFLQPYLGIKTGSYYNESIVKQLNKRLAELPFVDPVKNAEVDFYGTKANVTFFLNKKNTNQFDGILGFLPDTKTGKLQLTGNARLQLQNAFKRAETIRLDFKGLPKQSRELNLTANVPYIFSTPLGVDVAFNLYKQDTSFQNISIKTAAIYKLSYHNSLSFYVENRSGNVIDAANKITATLANTSSILYGLNYSYKKLDYGLNPSKGVGLKIDISAGFRNTQAVNVDASSKSEQYRLDGQADIYTPIAKNNVFYLKNQTAILFGGKLFDNELFQLGGFYDLRGFDERSILASRYTLFNAEYRYLFDRNSFLSFFLNQAFVQRQTVSLNQYNRPFGFGAGITVETKVGIVSLNYALGKQENNPVNLRRGKIHFGLIALF